MKRAAIAAGLVLIGACSSEDNLGNHVFGKPRWSVALGSSGVETATALAVDTIGNVIVAGTCDGLVDFGSGPVPCTGAFISQRSSETGAEEWTVRLADTRVGRLVRIDDRLHAIGTRSALDGIVTQFMAVFDEDGEEVTRVELPLTGVVTSAVGTLADDGCVFATGGFIGTTGTADTLDVYVASYWPDGSPAWHTEIVGAGRQVGTEIAVSPDNHLVVLAESSDPIVVGGTTIEAASWPAQLLLRLSPDGEVVWAKAMTDPVHQLALTPAADVVLGGCPSSGTLDPDGDENWRVECKDPLARVDAVAVSPRGLIVIGGHHDDSSVPDGELFLVAFDDKGNLISSARSSAHPEPSESRIDAIAVEPTGEVVFATTASHAFDFGNGLLPHHGATDVVVAKLDSSTGRDGQVVLARQLP